MTWTVIFAAGGTAGHVFIARGIANYIKGKRVLITDRRGIKYACDCIECIYKNGARPCEGVFDEVHVLPIISIRLCTFHKVIESFYKSLILIGKYSNPIFFGCGAYTSLIVGLAAIVRRIPIQIYQGDQIIGRANKILQHFAKISWVSSDNLMLRNKMVAGCISRHYIQPQPLLNTNKFRILIVGSSIGGSLLSKIIPIALRGLPKDLLSKIEIVHQIREHEINDMQAEYSQAGVACTLASFINTEHELPKAHLVIGRSGWSVISDVVAANRAAILIPWAGASENHQYHNAVWLCQDAQSMDTKRATKSMEDARPGEDSSRTHSRQSHPRDEVRPSHPRDEVRPSHPGEGAKSTQWMLIENDITPEILTTIIESLAKNMLEQNQGQECITYGMIANRIEYVKNYFHAHGGELVAVHINHIHGCST